MNGRLVIATRRSPLALWQAGHVAARLRAACPGVDVTLAPMSTEGDRRLGSSLADIGGKGLFVKELEQAMLRGEAHLAVHSMKDVPAELPDGFVIAAVLDRADPRDALVAAKAPSARAQVAATLDGLPRGARVGTSSARRAGQLRARRPDLVFVPVRGNVGTRLGRLDAGEVDALVLALSGLERLGLGGRASEVLDVEVSLPAGGQGALGIECRADAAAVIAHCVALRDDVTERCVGAERAVSRHLGASCTMPLAAFAVPAAGGGVHLRARLCDPQSQRLLAAECVDADPERAGERVAAALLEQGAAAVLAGAR